MYVMYVIVDIQKGMPTSSETGTCWHPMELSVPTIKQSLLYTMFYSAEGDYRKQVATNADILSLAIWCIYIYIYVCVCIYCMYIIYCHMYT